MIIYLINLETRSMYESDRYFTKRVFDEQMSESSGISLSQSSTCTERYFPSTKSNLLQIAERRNETQTTFRQVQSRQHSTPIFPKIENKVRLDVKSKLLNRDEFEYLQP